MYELEPWQHEFLKRVERGDRWFIFGGRHSGRRFTERCLIESVLAAAEEVELVGDNLHVTYPDGTKHLLVGHGRLLVDDVLAEAERSR